VRWSRLRLHRNAAQRLIRPLRSGKICDMDTHA
jgi:hypothetical protein